MQDRDQIGERAPLLGGFLALASPGPGGLFALWQVDPQLAWTNASSALAALVAQVKPRAVWLPGYFCRPTLAAVPEALRRFYPLTQALEPDLHHVRPAPGDMVLAVDYFGRSPGSGWRAFLADHPDVLFVEDCAQALDAGPAWGDWRLHSIRKVLGVPEGGFLIPISDRARAAAIRGPGAEPDPVRVAERLLPLKTRAEAPTQNALWHPMHQRAENGMIPSDERISRFALDLAATLDPAAAIDARKANFAILADALPDLALLPEMRPDFAPLGFPIRLPAARRDAVQAHLAGHGIFAAVHWRDLAAPAEFVTDHALAAESLTLPVDPACTPQDMGRLIHILREVCP